MGIVVASLLFVLLIAVAIFILSVLGVTASLSFGGRSVAELPPDQVLRYHVPEGQDPTVLMHALHRAGFDCKPDSEHDHHDLVVLCPEGRDAARERVREAITNLHRTDVGLENPTFVVPPVRFADEAPKART